MTRAVAPSALLGGMAIALGLSAWRLTAPVETVVKPKDLPALQGTPARAQVDPGFVGVVVNSATVDLTPLQPGTVRQIKVRVGDVVKANDVLVALEATELQHEVEMARAQLKRDDAEIDRARLQARQAKERLTRADSAREHLNVDELSAAKYASEFAWAELRALQARRTQNAAKLAQLVDRLGHSTLRAPLDAVVSERFFDPGAAVTAGTPVLRLLGRGGFRVRFAIPTESDVEVRVDGGVLVAAEDGEWPGVVTELAPNVDPASMTRFAEAQLHVTDGGPSYGAQVRVRRRP